MTTESSFTPVQSFQVKLLAFVAAVAIFGAFSTLCFLWGVFFAGTALHDPDSCWLIAMGRWIYEHGSLPSTDQFSYTFSDLNRPYVTYQWLTELTFYLLLKFLRLGGMVVFLAALVAIAMAGVPLLVAKELTGRLLMAFTVVLLLLLAVATHALVRPEIFSYVFLSIWMALLVLWRRDMQILSSSAKGRDSDKSSSDFPMPRSWLIRSVCLVLLMLLWANFHSAFTLGLLFLALLTVSTVFDYRADPNNFGGHLKLLFGTLIGAIAATLANPKFLDLWRYLPGLYFSSINKYIDELKPLGLADLKNPGYYPFFVLATLTFRLFLPRAFLFLKQRSNSSSFGALLYSKLLIVLCVFASMRTRRMIPFTAIILASECVFLHYLNQARSNVVPQNSASEKTDHSDRPKFTDMLNDRLFSLFSPTLGKCVLTVGTLACFGAFITVSRIQPPNLPQTSSVVHVPNEALSFLADHPQSGRLFNDAQLGDMLIWRSPANPLVFIDTRFDMYGEGFVSDYHCMRYASPGFEKLFRQYQIDWAFLPADAQLVSCLLDELSWHELYRDDKAVILSRR